MDIAPLEQMTDAVLAADAHLFDVKPATLLKSRKRRGELPTGYTAANPPPGLAVSFLTTEKTAAEIELTCKTADGKEVGVYKGSGKPGLDSVTFDLKDPGEYTITLKAGKQIVQSKKGLVRTEE